MNISVNQGSIGNGLSGTTDISTESTAAGLPGTGLIDCRPQVDEPEPLSLAERAAVTDAVRKLREFSHDKLVEQGVNRYEERKARHDRLISEGLELVDDLASQGRLKALVAFAAGRDSDVRDFTEVLLHNANLEGRLFVATGCLNGDIDLIMKNRLISKAINGAGAKEDFTVALVGFLKDNRSELARRCRDDEFRKKFEEEICWPTDSSHLTASLVRDIFEIAKACGIKPNKSMMVARNYFRNAEPASAHMLSDYDRWRGIEERYDLYRELKVGRPLLRALSNPEKAATAADRIAAGYASGIFSGHDTEFSRIIPYYVKQGLSVLAEKDLAAFKSVAEYLSQDSVPHLREALLEARNEIDYKRRFNLKLVAEPDELKKIIDLALIRGPRNERSWPGSGPVFLGLGDIQRSGQLVAHLKQMEAYEMSAPLIDEILKTADILVTRDRGVGNLKKELCEKCPTFVEALRGQFYGEDSNPDPAWLDATRQDLKPALFPHLWQLKHGEHESLPLLREAMYPLGDRLKYRFQIAREKLARRFTREESYGSGDGGYSPTISMLAGFLMRT